MEQFHLTSLLDFFVNSAQFPSAFTIFYGMDIFSLPCGAKQVFFYKKLIA